MSTMPLRSTSMNWKTISLRTVEASYGVSCFEGLASVYCRLLRVARRRAEVIDAIKASHLSGW
jgi:hypothetical protein